MAGCDVHADVTIGELAQFTADITTTSATCSDKADGRLDIVVNGTIVPYTYSIHGNAHGSTPTFNGLLGATYAPFVKDGKECKISK